MKTRCNVVRSLVVVCCLVSISACTRSPENRGAFVAGGSAVGAGLGAIIGAQTGHAAGGAVIGAIAGATIGNAASCPRAANGSQRSCSAAEEKRLGKQLSKPLGKESVAASETSVGTAMAQRDVPFTSPALTQAPHDPQRMQLAEAYAHARVLREKDAHARVSSHPARNTRNEIISPKEREAIERDLSEARAQMSRTVQAEQVLTGDAAKMATVEDGVSPCDAAQDEVNEARTSASANEKLFHLKRALRLCPSSAEFHMKLGELYRTRGRSDDAIFEFEEVLRLDPKNARARAYVSTLRRAKGQVRQRR